MPPATTKIVKKKKKEKNTLSFGLVCDVLHKEK